VSERAVFSQLDVRWPVCFGDLFRKLPAKSSQRVIIDEPSHVPVNSVRMGKSGDDTEVGRTGDDYDSIEKSWISGSK
jgi:hypothetical protein